MAKLSKETKQRLQQLFQCGQFVIRWGFIPTVLYLVCFGAEEHLHPTSPSLMKIM
ncbi:mitochondrial import receptor subunit TOM7 homolog [Xyrichtys novacula]|uniref:Mitochondrial import receptor subunit TOM7 homolog n=1 Tax=Xyrichtys novacula TaxID=13765 RepID=A0AAV1HD16_XYRNO|nr:mitochondrial import receptor subunit TOM7 homolog [Xyrichtys novacula]